jgi:hypothetical protein
MVVHPAITSRIFVVDYTICGLSPAAVPSKMWQLEMSPPDASLVPPRILLKPGSSEGVPCLMLKQRNLT